MRPVFFNLSVVMMLLATSAVSRAEDAKPTYRTLTGHKGSVLSVEFTHDGKTLVSGSRDHTIMIWDVASGTLNRTLTNHTADVYSVHFSHDGNLMASGSVDKKIIIWNAKTYEPIRTLEGHTAAIREVDFSPDDKTLASVAEDNTFRLWDVATGQLKVTRTEHTGHVKGLRWYPDGNTIVTASLDGTLRTWDGHSGEPKLQLKGHTNGIEFVALLPDAKQLFSGTANIGEVAFWNAQTGELEKLITKAHGNDFGAEVDSGQYSPDGKWAVSGSKDRSDKFWDPKTFELLHTISGNPGRSESTCFSDDGKIFCTGFGGTDFTIRLWDVSCWKD